MSDQKTWEQIVARRKEVGDKYFRNKTVLVSAWNETQQKVLDAEKALKEAKEFQFELRDFFSLRYDLMLKWVRLSLRTSGKFWKVADLDPKSIRMDNDFIWINYRFENSLWHEIAIPWDLFMSGIDSEIWIEVWITNDSIGKILAVENKSREIRRRKYEKRLASRRTRQERTKKNQDCSDQNS